MATASLASPVTLRWFAALVVTGMALAIQKKEDLSIFDQKETPQSSLHYAGFEAGAEAGEPVAGFGAKTAGERLAGCCRDVVEVEVVRRRARTQPPSA